MDLRIFALVPVACAILFALACDLFVGEPTALGALGRFRCLANGGGLEGFDHEHSQSLAAGLNVSSLFSMDLAGDLKYTRIGDTIGC